MKFQRPRGTEDLYQKQVVLYSNIINCLTLVAKKFNYQEIITPVIEPAELFLRSIGSTTNIVEKEIYQFLDKSDRMLALRPEGTAGVIRAVVENKLYNNQKQTQKYFYYGSMYRYENPQKGRNREFHQFGVEVLGTKHPLLDGEVILLAKQMLTELNINDTELHINYFGSEATKAKFNEALLVLLQKEKNKLCGDCQKRIAKNPLRVLDCQICRKLDLNLPNLEQFYSPEEKQYWQELTAGLAKLAIEFQIDPFLVRGLDYYNGVIFEFMTASNSDVLGKSQNTLIGGGRYDNLAEQLGVPYHYPAIGFAFGVERLMLMLANNVNFTSQKRLDLLLVAQEESGLLDILGLLAKLRKTKYFVDGIFDLFNDKQKSNLIKNLQDTNNLLIFQQPGQATLYQLNKTTKETINYQNEQELLEKVTQFLL